ncbi:regulatory protein RecX [Pleomorphochaeta sp. DL1XJH-081]|uniref:regulatory protein RecX n=1 Tax=Pleomorphochaeta sp. DL1XJH-081 TaxID=3409690 RepID=UPI003BB6D1FC
MAYATIRRGASKDGYFAVPVEGSSFFISFAQLAQLGLHDGQELDEQEFFLLRDKMLGARCRLKAMDLLARREHGRKELELKLRQKDFPPAIIAEQLDRLESEHLLDDYRFANQFIISRQRKNPEGAQVLILRLVQRGVDRSIAQQAASQWFSDSEAAFDAIAKAVQRLSRKCNADSMKLTSELRKKGFSSAEIQRYFEEQGDR